MAEGLNVDGWALASPVWEIAGQEDADAMTSLEDYDPTDSLPYMGSLPDLDDVGGDSQMPDLNIAVTASSRAGKKPPSSSASVAHLLDVKNGTLFWLVGAFIAYYALIGVQLHHRVRAGVR
jgi:hypothetical protein